MAIRKLARSTTSGSRAAFSMTVSPSASVAAIIRFSVPVTVTVSSTRRAPLQALGAGADVAALDVDVGAHGLQPGDVDVHRTRADGAAAGQRDVGAPEARHQRPQHQDRGAHGLHQLVGREALLDAWSASTSMRMRSSMVTRHAHAPEQLDGGGHVLQVRHVGRSSPGRRPAAPRPGSAAWRSWRRRCAPRPRAARRPGSAACPCAQPVPPTLPASAPRSTARGSRVPCARRACGTPAGGAPGCACRQTRCATTRAAKWVLSSDCTRTSAPGRPARISRATSSGFMGCDITWAAIAHAPIMPPHGVCHAGRPGHPPAPRPTMPRCWPPRAARWHRGARRRGARRTPDGPPSPRACRICLACHGPRGRHRHGQVRARRRQDRRHAGQHRHAGVLPAPGRGQPRRPRHDHRARTWCWRCPTPARPRSSCSCCRTSSASACRSSS